MYAQTCEFYYDPEPTEPLSTAVVQAVAEAHDEDAIDQRWVLSEDIDSDALNGQFQTYCRDHDIPITLTALHALAPLSSGRQYDLTEDQRETLVLGYSRGYFDSPRTATQNDLADDLDITRQAVASRLQRGLRRLVASTLITDQDAD